MTSKALRAMIAASVLTTAAFAARPFPDLDPSGGTILCYHIVEYPADPRMEISRNVFQQQMRYLSTTGYSVVPLRDIYEYATGKRSTLPKNAVAITLDDGWRSAYTEAFPELKKRHFPFTLFIYPRIIGMTPYALTWKQVKEMAIHFSPSGGTPRSTRSSIQNGCRKSWWTAAASSKRKRAIP
ncbi:MAG: hypothetical protein DMF59_07310 [Acidobacteria bacterium]|nr:MAG: hypothetical protein DMF59_07310 [Acidobacteriota bacterium]